MKYNFSAGPAILPKEVFSEAAQAVTDYDNTGLSLLELSHRGPEFTAILDEAVRLPLELLGLSEDDYQCLFLTGGASSQFFMTAMNLLNENYHGYYIDTGTWSTKAIKEAKLFGKIEVLASSKEDNYKSIPKKYASSKSSGYLHYTSNNTIFGTQYQSLPDHGALDLICDMSSDIFSRPLPGKNYGIIYAGAQKNLGPAGTTLVIIKKSLLKQINSGLTSMLDYKIHAAKNSSFNTPPVFPIYVSLLTMRWIKNNGGVEAMAKRNQQKAEAIYQEIERNNLFDGFAAKEDRSYMNATFTIKQKDLEEQFLEDCANAGVVGIKGHRSVGGFRASIYNAMDIQGINKLVEVMKAFESKHS
ncbi:MAG: 3-phosphoserine/phosphohydroxythreonine transaminase [Saprospiraceae bacterium]|nr:3-phosphoserine/phosphohydroxythreonine transaminase [Saprospiraceae bacterium]